jgi:hypothetical protein
LLLLLGNNTLGLQKVMMKKEIQRFFFENQGLKAEIKRKMYAAACQHERAKTSENEKNCYSF